ncbi:MAG: hypothetical protein ACXU87_21835, partial [Xanthobacteraceae bacterium]
SGARTAVSASAPHNVAVTSRMIWFFRVTGFLRQSLATMACRTWPERRRGGSPDLETGLVESSSRLADSEICQLFQWIPKATHRPH